MTRDELSKLSDRELLIELNVNLKNIVDRIEGIPSRCVHHEEQIKGIRGVLAGAAAVLMLVLGALIKAVFG
jgi:hypothetical protein